MFGCKKTSVAMGFTDIEITGKTTRPKTGDMIKYHKLGPMPDTQMQTQLWQNYIYQNLKGFPTFNFLENISGFAPDSRTTISCIGGQ